METALERLAGRGLVLETQRLNRVIEACLQRAQAFENDGDMRASIRYRRRATALDVLKETGSLSAAVIAHVVLPEGYRGKIMLVRVQGGCIPARNCLRSGDDWHREIVRGFEEEVRDYGFENVLISPLGGACAEFRSDGVIVLSGSSEEFGPCRREDALKMVQETYPGRTVFWSDTADI